MTLVKFASEDVSELTKIAACAGTLTGAAKKVFADGKVDLKDLGVVVAALAALSPNVGIDFSQLPAEATDVEESEFIALGKAFYGALRAV
jgi:hypothetical protein